MALFNLLNRLFYGPSCLRLLATGVAASGLALCSFNLLFFFKRTSASLLPTARWPRSMAESSSFSN